MRTVQTRWAYFIPALCLLGGCAEPKPEDRGDFVNEWHDAPEGLEETIALLDERQLFQDTVSTLNARYGLPRDLRIVHRECGNSNSFYNAGTKSILLCYELLAGIAEQVKTGPKLSAEEASERVRATWLFIFFHEVGHALIDLYDLPVTGKEEDAVDNFSTLLLLHVGSPEVAMLAAGYWAASGPRVYSDLDYADEHSLSVQRFYTILCMVYGSDPEAHEHLIEEGFLSEARASRCPGEFARMESSWDKLLQPWVK